MLCVVCLPFDRLPGKKKKNWVRGYRSFPDLAKEKFHTGNRLRVVPLHSRVDPSGMYYWDSTYSTGSTLKVECA